MSQVQWPIYDLLLRDFLPTGRVIDYLDKISAFRVYLQPASTLWADFCVGKTLGLLNCICLTLLRIVVRRFSILKTQVLLYQFSLYWQRNGG